jgi:uncharacterized protein (TIGR00730 family)
MPTVCVFCGSSPGDDPAYREVAVALGTALAAAGHRLVYGGGRVGLMGAVADAVMHAGGAAVGVIPQSLLAREVGHHGLTELHVTGSMHERKALMADLADAFVALPGGLGTWEELLEILTWAQLGEHAKPVVVLDVGGFYDPLFALLDRAVAARFVRAEHRALARRATSVEACLALLQETPPPPQPKWIDREQT